MSYQDYIGKSVKLYMCPAETDERRHVLITGTFEVEEYYPVEPSNYVWVEAFGISRVVPGESAPDATYTQWYFVEADSLVAVIDQTETLLKENNLDDPEDI